jgi:hypothetical protein
MTSSEYDKAYAPYDRDPIVLRHSYSPSLPFIHHPALFTHFLPTATVHHLLVVIIFSQHESYILDKLVVSENVRGVAKCSVTISSEARQKEFIIMRLLMGRCFLVSLSSQEIFAMLPV